MKRLLLALLLACALPVAAQQQTVTWMGPGVTTVGPMALVSSSTPDALVAGLSGSAWATAIMTVGTAGSATVTVQTSNDGLNYMAAPFAKKISAASSNPTVQAISATTLTTGDVWEIPLPGNTRFVKTLCAGTGTATNVSLQGGTPYTAGAPVFAVLYDTTSGSNAALDTGTLDVSGWVIVTHDFSMNGGTPAFSVSSVDETGATLGNLVTGTAAFSGGFGMGVTAGGTSGLVNSAAQFPLPRRARYQSGAIVGQTSRLRVIGRR